MNAKGRNNVNICFLFGGFFNAGGIGRVVSVLVNQLVENEKVGVYCLALGNKKKALQYEVDERVHNDYLFDSAYTMKKAFLEHGVNKLSNYLLSNRIDTLIACGTLYFPLGILAARVTKVKCICWDHTGPNVTSDHPFQKLSRNIGGRYSDINVLLTQKAKIAYDKRYPKSNNVVIYNPIDPNSINPTGDYDLESKKILSVGRLTYQKNYEDMVSIAKEVLTIYKDWTWEIYGTGDQKEKIQQLVEESGVRDRLKLMGTVNDMYSRYKKYAMIVSTSRYEGFPMTLLEACANGLPMISFDIETGPSEIIDEKNGFLIAWDENKNHNMVKAICTLIEDSDKRRKCPEESYHTIGEIIIEKTIKDWIDILDL